MSIDTPTKVAQRVHVSDLNPDTVWRDFWFPILQGFTRRSPDFEKIKAELFDYYHLIRNASEVYDHVTNGLISKPNTLPSEVIAVHDDLESGRIELAAVKARYCALVEVDKRLPAPINQWAFDPGAVSVDWLLERINAGMELRLQKVFASHCYLCSGDHPGFSREVEYIDGYYWHPRLDDKQKDHIPKRCKANDLRIAAEIFSKGD